MCGFRVSYMMWCPCVLPDVVSLYVLPGVVSLCVLPCVVVLYGCLVWLSCFVCLVWFLWCVLEHGVLVVSLDLARRTDGLRHLIRTYRRLCIGLAPTTHVG